MLAANKPPTNFSPSAFKHHNRNSSIQASSDQLSYQTFAFDDSGEITAQSPLQETSNTPQFNYKVRSFNFISSIGESVRSFEISTEVRKSKVQFPNFEDLPSLKIPCFLSSTDSSLDTLGSLTTDHSIKLRASLENYSLILNKEQQQGNCQNELLETIKEEITSPKSNEEQFEITLNLQVQQQLRQIKDNLLIINSALLIQRW